MSEAMRASGVLTPTWISKSAMAASVAPSPPGMKDKAPAKMPRATNREGGFNLKAFVFRSVAPELALWSRRLSLPRRSGSGGAQRRGCGVLQAAGSSMSLGALATVVSRHPDASTGDGIRFVAGHNPVRKLQISGNSTTSSILRR
jgi:hypothetical protein